MPRCTRCRPGASLRVGAVCLALLIGACSSEPSTGPSRTPLAPTARSSHDRDTGCATDDNTALDLAVIACDSTSLAPTRSGYLVAAGHK